MSEPNTPLAVTDTHALIWAIGGKRKSLALLESIDILDYVYILQNDFARLP